MDNDNPYNPTDAPPEPDVQSRSSRLKRFAIGALIGLSPPLILGGYGLYQFNAYVASLPPGQAACGNSAIGPMLLIIFVAPLTAIISGSIALKR